MISVVLGLAQKKGDISRRTKVKQTEMLLLLIAEEINQTDRMYDANPKGYKQKVADTNNRLYADFLRRMFEDAYGVTLEGARILVDLGVAKTMSRAYFCARSELVRHQGSQLNVGDAFEIICGLVDEWRPVLESMNPGLPGNEDLVEIMWSIQLDEREESDLKCVRA